LRERLVKHFMFVYLNQSRYTDVVRSGRGYSFVIYKEEGSADGYAV